MSECVKAFNILKKRMDEKEFDYNKKQLWEKEVEDSINNFSLEKFIDDFCKLFNSDDHERQFNTI